MTATVLSVLSFVIGLSFGIANFGSYDIVRFLGGGKMSWRRWLAFNAAGLVIGLFLGVLTGWLISSITQEEFKLSLLPYGVGAVAGYFVEELTVALAKRGILRVSGRDVPF